MQRNNFNREMGVGLFYIIYFTFYIHKYLKKMRLTSNKNHTFLYEVHVMHKDNMIKYPKLWIFKVHLSFIDMYA